MGNEGGYQNPQQGLVEGQGLKKVQLKSVVSSVMGDMYVNSSIGEQPMEWLIDTNCDVALVSKSLLQNFQPGESLKVTGWATMTIKLEKQKLNFEVIVADCENDELLGLNS